MLGLGLVLLYRIREGVWARRPLVHPAAGPYGSVRAAGIEMHATQAAGTVHHPGPLKEWLGG
jgi:hypothetical protein